MSLFLPLASAAGLFGLGVYLSAVFSGAETAFYRLSTLKLLAAAEAGDRTASRLAAFARDPGRFVATILVGNNVANYLTTAAVGVGVGVLFGGAAAGGSAGGGYAEVLATWAIAPVVFVAGELLPKRMCYLAPWHFLSRSSRFLRAVAVLVAPVAVPLAGLARLLEGRGGGGRARGGFLDRGRLSGLLVAGEEAGLLTDAQGRLVESVLRATPHRALDRAAPLNLFPTLPAGCTREDLLRLAAARGVGEVLLTTRENGGPPTVAGYVRVAEVAAGDRKVKTHLRTPAEVPASATAVETLVALRHAGESLAVLTDPGSGRPAGVVRERDLLADLLR